MRVEIVVLAVLILLFKSVQKSFQRQPVDIIKTTRNDQKAPESYFFRKVKEDTKSSRIPKIAKNNLENEIHQTIRKRAAVRKHGCSYISIISNLVQSKASLETLIGFHKAIYK